MYGYFCIGFVDFMLKGKSLLDYTNLYTLNDYEKNRKVILKYFQYLKWWNYYITIFAISIEQLENEKCQNSYKKRLLFLLFAVNVKKKKKRYTKKKNQLRY